MIAAAILNICAGAIFVKIVGYTSRSCIIKERDKIIKDERVYIHTPCIRRTKERR